MVDFNNLMRDMDAKADRHCDMCGFNYTIPKREDQMGVGVCPACGCGSWEGEGSKMLDQLLNLESGLWDSELSFVESLAQERQRWRAQGFKPDHLPSVKQINWLKKIHARLIP